MLSLFKDDEFHLFLMFICSAGNFRSRGRGGFGNRGMISGSNTVPLGAGRPW
jgi:hypothetical protein